MATGTLTRSTTLQGSVTQTSKEQTYTFATAEKLVDKDISLKVTVSDGSIGAPTIDSTTGKVTAKISTSGYLSKDTTSSALSLSTQSAATITPGTTTKTAVSAGKYTLGAVTVAGDSDLVSSNIKKDVDIFGVTGTLDYIKDVISIPSTKDTSVIHDTTTGKYYLWRD